MTGRDFFGSFQVDTAVEDSCVQVAKLEYLLFAKNSVVDKLLLHLYHLVVRYATKHLYQAVAEQVGTLALV